MPFVQTTTQIASGYNQTTFTDALKTFLAASLGAAIDDYTVSNVRSLVFKPLDPANPDYNRVFIRLAVSSTHAVSIFVSDAWNVGTHAGTRESNVAGTVGSFNTTTSPVNFALFKSAEAILLSVSNGTNKGCGGMVKVLDAPSWWNEATYHKWVNTNSAIGYIPANSGNNPLTVTTAAQIQGTFQDPGSLSLENPATGKRDLVAGGIGVVSVIAYWGRLTDDLGYAAAGGTTGIFDTYTTDDTTPQVWVSLDGGTSRAFVARTQ